ncbi:MAG: twin-arginine translocase TatA/TatE family subunit [Coriobacteriales bacterium]|nr:twin-arginine translocase TatA/TatE family subunit [Coriobacteriales bacterium]
MFGIGGLELVIILVFAFLIFGPDKLPGVIKNVSHVWNSLKGLREQADQVIKAEVVEPLKDIEATINPLAEEGTSVTDKLASKLGLKPTPKKDEKATEEDKGEEKGEAKGEARGEEGVVPADGKTPEADAASGAVAAATIKTAVSAGPGDESSTKPAAKPKLKAATITAATPEVAAKVQGENRPEAAAKPKTESFAEKKARLEREHRDKQAASTQAADAAGAAGAATLDETPGN